PHHGGDAAPAVLDLPRARRRPRRCRSADEGPGAPGRARLPPHHARRPGQRGLPRALLFAGGGEPAPLGTGGKGLPAHRGPVPGRHPFPLAGRGHHRRPGGPQGDVRGLPGTLPLRARAVRRNCHGRKPLIKWPLRKTTYPLKSTGICRLRMPPFARILRGPVLALALCATGAAVAADAARVQSLLDEGRLPEALKAVDEGLRKDAKDVTFRFLKGLVLARMDRLDESAAIFEQLTREHPELPEPYNNLAVVYAARGDFEKARQALQRAINTHPAYATAHENLGDIYAKMASQAYNHALELDQDNATARAKLALVNDLFSLPASAPAPA